MTISAVVGILVPVVVLAVAQFIIQLCIQTVLHKLGDGLLKQVLDVAHAADVCQLQQFMDFGSVFISFRGAIPSCHSKTSDVVLLFYTTSEVYTKCGMISFRMLAHAKPYFDMDITENSPVYRINFVLN